MSTFSINNVDLTLDLTDINILATYEECMSTVKKAMEDKSARDFETTAEYLKYQCTVVRDTFGSLFGIDTADKIFAKKENNILAHMEAFADLVQEGEKSAQSMKAVAMPFMQPPNRKQRRAEMKKTKKKKKSVGKK